MRMVLSALVLMLVCLIITPTSSLTLEELSRTIPAVPSISKECYSALIETSSTTGSLPPAGGDCKRNPVGLPVQLTTLLPANIKRECPQESECPKNITCADATAHCCRGGGFCCPAGTVCLSTDPPSCLREDIPLCNHYVCRSDFACPLSKVAYCCKGGRVCCPQGSVCTNEPTPRCKLLTRFQFLTSTQPPPVPVRESALQSSTEEENPLKSAHSYPPLLQVPLSYSTNSTTDPTVTTTVSTPSEGGPSSVTSSSVTGAAATTTTTAAAPDFAPQGGYVTPQDDSIPMPVVPAIRIGGTPANTSTNSSSTVSQTASSTSLPSEPSAPRSLIEPAERSVRATLAPTPAPTPQPTAPAPTQPPTTRPIPSVSSAPLPPGFEPLQTSIMVDNSGGRVLSSTQRISRQQSPDEEVQVTVRHQLTTTDTKYTDGDRTYADAVSRLNGIVRVQNDNPRTIN